MSERHGIERLRWLLEDDPDVGSQVDPHFHAPRFTVMGERSVNIEVAFALIEELHDAVLRFEFPLFHVMPDTISLFRPDGTPRTMEELLAERAKREKPPP